VEDPGTVGGMPDDRAAVVREGVHDAEPLGDGIQPVGEHGSESLVRHRDVGSGEGARSDLGHGRFQARPVDGASPIGGVEVQGLVGRGMDQR
jgi:hypothetical protein